LGQQEKSEEKLRHRYSRVKSCEFIGPQAVAEVIPGGE
jgi:hypothetical protein